MTTEEQLKVERYVAINYLRGSAEGRSFLASFRHLRDVSDSELVMKMYRMKDKVMHIDDLFGNSCCGD